MNRDLHRPGLWGAGASIALAALALYQRNTDQFAHNVANLIMCGLIAYIARPGEPNQ